MDNGNAVVPTCGHPSKTRWIHAHCHLDGRLWAEYNPEEGWLRLVCGECHKAVAIFALAEKPKKE
jgi:hypothetical protein